MINPSARKQLSNAWQGAVEDLMAMTESEIDAELRELGIDPRVADEKGKLAVEQGVAKARAGQRARLREQMLDARDKPKIARDPSVTPEQARQRIAQMQAANDEMLTLAARNRNPQDFTDEEALETYWQIQELKS